MYVYLHGSITLTESQGSRRYLDSWTMSPVIYGSYCFVLGSKGLKSPPLRHEACLKIRERERENFSRIAECRVAGKLPRGRSGEKFFFRVGDKYRFYLDSIAIEGKQTLARGAEDRLSRRRLREPFFLVSFIPLSFFTP